MVLLDAAARIQRYLDARRGDLLYSSPVVAQLWTGTKAVFLFADDIDAVVLERNALLGAMNAVYRERAELVAFLSRLYATVWADDGENPGWRIVYVDSPAGQLSWHIAPGDWHLFAHVPHDVDVAWDGHSTPEKYERLRRIASPRAA